MIQEELDEVFRTVDITFPGDGLDLASLAEIPGHKLTKFFERANEAYDTEEAKQEFFELGQENFEKLGTPFPFQRGTAEENHHALQLIVTIRSLLVAKSLSVGLAVASRAAEDSNSRSLMRTINNSFIDEATVNKFIEESKILKLYPESFSGLSSVVSPPLKNLVDFGRTTSANLRETEEDSDYESDEGSNYESGEESPEEQEFKSQLKKLTAEISKPAMLRFQASQ